MSTAAIRVGAVIVHHRGLRLLECCLESLLASSGVELTIVVVANACTEPLPEVASSSSRVHVVTSERSIGFSAANNLGADWLRSRCADCQLLFFVNNDTLVETTTLERLAAGLTASETRAIAGPRLMIWGADGVLNSLGLNVTGTGEAWDEGIGRPLSDYQPLDAVRDVLAVTGAALMIRRRLFEQLGGWEELYGFYFEDIDLCLRVRSHGHQVVVVNDAVMRHAISATAARGSDLKRQLSWRNRLLLMAIHWPWPLLLRAGSRTAAGELRLAWRRARARAWADLRLQLRSWLGAIERLPAAWRCRRRLGQHCQWTERLRPHGSVPPITLPELPREAVLRPESSADG